MKIGGTERTDRQTEGQTDGVQHLMQPLRECHIMKKLTYRVVSAWQRGFWCYFIIFFISFTHYVPFT